jgi:TPR repeat protein
MEILKISGCACLAGLLAVVHPLAAQEASAPENPPQASAEGSDEVDHYQAGVEAFNRFDLPGAMEHWRVAADAGDSRAQARLGYIFDQSENNDEAVAYYRASAEQGNVDGISGLAEMYLKGEGVEQHSAEALALFRKAGEGGHLQSIVVLIMAYEKGSMGVDPDDAEVAYWQAKKDAIVGNQ